ncbi:MAG: hypothetical protein ACFCUQ_13145 [Kiloniellales bacterium]
MTRLLVAVVVLGGLGLATGSLKEARAGGGFHVGIGTGYHFGHDHYGRYKHGYYPRYRHHYPRYSLWGHSYRPWYRPRHRPPPRTVYVRPPQPAPQVLVQPPPQAPVVRQPPALAYDTSYCREYSRTAIVGGAPVEVFGTACRQPDGTWRIVN